MHASVCFAVFMIVAVEAISLFRIQYFDTLNPLVDRKLFFSSHYSQTNIKFTALVSTGMIALLSADIGAVSSAVSQ